jgi:hypothetical protein
MFLTAGLLKAFKYDAAVATLKWPGDLPRPVVAFIGIAESCGALGLVLPALTGVMPWLTSLAALGLATVMVLAAIFHLSRKEFAALPINLGLCALALFVAYGRLMPMPFL